jgi:hypothetical protein
MPPGSWAKLMTSKRKTSAKKTSTPARKTKLSEEEQQTIQEWASLRINVLETGGTRKEYYNGR